MPWFNSWLVLLYPSYAVVRGSLKTSKSGRKYVSKSAQDFFLQSLLYLLFISGISLAFRIIESTTEFSSMIQSLVSCESGVSVQDGGHILCVFTPVCYSAFVNTELHFFLVQFAQIT